MDRTVDHYAMLGVSPQATPDEIKRAYRRRARDLHPDANPGDPDAEARFKELARSYEVLSDPQRRQLYDTYGTDDPQAAQMPFGGGLGDVFSMLFGQGFGGGPQGPSGPPQGPDIEATASVPFVTAVFGGDVSVEVRTAQACGDCEATGARSGSAPVTCPDCGGHGQVRRVRQSMLGQMMSTSPCRRCGASGVVIDDPCGSCGGEGRVIVEQAFDVDVPAGIDDGQTLRLPGRGAVGPRGGAAGDLYVHVSVEPDPRFVRVGYDLVCELPVALTQAVLGAELELETLEEPVLVVIDPGTAPGHRIVMGGRGVPHVHGRGRGDLVVEVVVVIPTDLDDPQEELVRQLAGLRGEAVAEARPGLFSRVRSALR